MSALRPYQVEATEALYRFWGTGGWRGGVGLPTGVGKTHVMAHLARRELDTTGQVTGLRGPHERVLYLLHRDVLVDQTVAKVRATLGPTASVGVVKAERNEVGARVLVASVHTLRTAARRAMLPPVGLCVVDEAHVSRSDTYMRTFEHLGAFSGRCRLAGFTATWSRSDERGLGDVWEEVVYHRTIRWAQAQRPAILVPVRGVRVGAGVDASALRGRGAGGEYSDTEAESVVLVEEVRDALVRGVLAHGAGRPGVLFAPTVRAAEYFADGLRAVGVSVAGVYHDTPPGERRRLFADHRDGRVRVLATCTALAEGWDAPHCSMGVLARPTRHEGLFVQLVGRLLRPWPGKTDALLLDCVGATTDLKLRAAVDLSVARERPDGGLEPDPDLVTDLEEGEPQERERLARLARADREVDLFAGTQVRWLQDPDVGVPFVSCGETLVFVVEGPDGWRVGQAASRLRGGRPHGAWVATGLGAEDALTVASDHAECEGGVLACRSSRWLHAAPTDQQVAVAAQVGIDVNGHDRGELSQALDLHFSARVLAPFAAWSQQWRTTL